LYFIAGISYVVFSDTGCPGSFFGSLNTPVAVLIGVHSPVSVLE